MKNAVETVVVDSKTNRGTEKVHAPPEMWESAASGVERRSHRKKKEERHQNLNGQAQEGIKLPARGKSVG